MPSHSDNSDNLKKEVGKRLKLFAVEHYASVTNLAKELEMSQPLLHVYVSGKSLPGSEILYKLRLKGCNINWLLTGQEIDEKEKVWEILKSKNIETVEKVMKIIEILEFLELKIKEL